MAYYSYNFSKTAKKDLDKLDNVTKQRIAKKLQYFANQKDILLHAKSLTDSVLGDYRFRIGHYRIVFDLQADVISVLKVQHRRDV